MKSRHRINKCRAAMNAATNYAIWRECAEELDQLTGRDKWRSEDSSPFYNYQMVRRHLDLMRTYRKSGNVFRLLDLLHDSLRRNMVDITHAELYSKALSGTKVLINAFLNEAVKSLNFLCDVEYEPLPLEKKIRLFKQALHNFGRTALMLSGGSTFGLFHLGVVKVLMEHDMLPQVMSGSSMGSIIAAGTCVRTDDEIRELMGNINILSRNTFRPLAPKEMWRQKAIMDPRQLAAMLHINIGDYTFAEAYERTGRILNISVSPTRTGMHPRVLNYHTAPNVLVTSACLASSAVPGLFPPSKLLAKDRAGQFVPYMQNEKWVDGSIRGDLPFVRLSRLHNVNHFIASQTNPHVIPFLGLTRGKGIAPLVMDLSAGMLHAQFLQAVNAARKRIHTSPVRSILDQMYAVTGQQYTGDINVHPTFRFWMYPKLLKNPTREDMDRWVLEGERATWPKLEMVNNQTLISRTLESCLNRLDPEKKLIEWRPL